MTTGLAVGVDVGGTKVAAGLVAGDGSVLSRDRRDTPADDADAITDAITDVVGDLCRHAGVEIPPVGVGAAGIIDLRGVVRYAPNVAWEDYPLRDALRERLGSRVVVENDANVAAWGEFCVGAGADARLSMLMLTIGTGVGGGLVNDGRLVRGANGLGAEFGHIIVAEGGPRCGCGNRGCVEALASGTAIGRCAQEARARGDVPAHSALAGVEELTGKTVTIAAHAGDAYATGILADRGFWLGVGVASVVNALDPEVVVVGGGAMQAGDLLLAPARAAFSERVLGRAHRVLPPVVRARLGDDAGMVGAALLALDPGSTPDEP